MIILGNFSIHRLAQREPSRILGENPSDQDFVSDLPLIPPPGYSRGVSNPSATAGHKEKRYGKPDEEHYREPGAAARKGRDLLERDPSAHGRHQGGLLRRAALPGPVAQ